MRFQRTIKLLKKLNPYIRALYQSAAESTVKDFKHQAMRIVQPIMAYDSGVWVNRSLLDNEYTGGLIEDTFTFNLPNNFISNYTTVMEETREQDPFYIELLEKTNKVLSIREVIPPERWKKTALYRMHMQKFGIEHGMSTIQKKRDSQVLHLISLYRCEESKAVTTKDKQKMQLIMPHLIESFRTNLLNNFKRSTTSFASRAICDRYGVIIEAEEHFYKVAKIFESAGHLNIDLDSLDCPATIVQGKTKLKIEFLQGLFYVEAEHTDRNILSNRELEITQLLIEGRSDKDIASSLQISKSTVNNHLTNIYKKLGIKSRKEIFSNPIMLRINYQEEKIRRITMTFEQELELSEFIASIYKKAYETNVDEFRQYCFDGLKNFISFGAGIWVTRRERDRAVTKADTFVYNLPNDFMDRYNRKIATRLHTQDYLAEASQNNPNIPVAVMQLFSSREKYYATDAYQLLGKYYNIEDVMSTFITSLTTDYFNIISLHKIGSQQNFTEKDAYIKTIISGHLVEAMRVNILSSFNRGWHYRLSFRAVCDIHGNILESEESFDKAMLKANESYNRHIQLPSLREGHSSKIYIENGIFIEATQQNAFIFLELVNPSAAEIQLTNRQKQICTFLCEGMSDKQIANELNISKYTVSNHLKTIYGKLNVSGRSAAIPLLIRY